MSKKQAPGPTGAERIAAEHRLAVERGMVIPADVLGLPPGPTSSLTPTRIVPPSLAAVGSAARVIKSAPRQGRPVRNTASGAALHAAIEDGLRRIGHGERSHVAGVLEQYAELAARPEHVGDFAALRRKVLSAAFGGDIGEHSHSERGAGAASRRFR